MEIDSRVGGIHPMEKLGMLIVSLMVLQIMYFAILDNSKK